MGRTYKETQIINKACKLIKCRFEDCASQEDGGAILANSAGLLLLRFCDFVRCCTPKSCGAVKKIGGSLGIECCNFNKCHGESGNTDADGNAAGSINADVNWWDILFLECWIKKTPITNNVFGITSGQASITRINCSHCISSSGSLCGCFNSVKPFGISYMQGIDGVENNANEARNEDVTIWSENLINNTFLAELLYTISSTITLRNCCLFGNNRYNIKGSGVLIDCLSEKCQSATLTKSTTFIIFGTLQCQTQEFTNKKTARLVDVLVFQHAILA